MIANIWIGYDSREAAAWHVCTQSIIERASIPVAIKPLTLDSLPQFRNHRNGTNNFITSRYSIPSLEDFSGWALFIDSDILLRCDIADLWELRDDRYAVMCVKHDYRTRSPRKYIDSPIENDNLDYDRKNWSSVMLMNCGHLAMRTLTQDYVNGASSQHLHRFRWLADDLIGELPHDMNHLVGEYPRRDDAKLVHWTLGVPGFSHYVDAEHSREWHATLLRANEIVGECPRALISRARERA